MTQQRDVAIAMYDLAHKRGFSLDELRYRAAHGDEQAGRVLSEVRAEAAGVVARTRPG